VLSYFFISFIKLEVQSGVELRCILRGALQYVDGAGDAGQQVRADAQSLCQNGARIVARLTALK